MFGRIYPGHERPGMGRGGFDEALRLGQRESGVFYPEGQGCRIGFPCGVGRLDGQRDGLKDRPGYLFAEGVVGGLPAERKEIIHDRWMGRILQGGLSLALPVNHPADIVDGAGDGEGG